MTVAERRRATTPAELQVKMDRLVSKAGFATGLGFVPRPSDVIIASYAKCGTTWLQQIGHSLRTGGDLDEPQRGEPRAFKRHLSYDQVPAGNTHPIAFPPPPLI
jgi:hypothetical protein